MAEMIWKIGIDSQEAAKAGKAFKNAASGSDSGGKGKKGDGAFKGGFLGGLLGSLLQSVKALFDPLSAIANLLVAALFPIFKPFLILFLKVGLLLYKWLSKITGGLETLTGGEKTDGALKTGAETVGAVGGGIVGAVVGGPVGAAIGATIGAAIGALLPNALQGLENIWTIATAWADKLLSIFGIDMDSVRQQIVTFFYQTLPEFFLVTIPQWFSAAISTLGDMGMWIWDSLTTVLTKAWKYLVTFGIWMWNSITDIFTTAWKVLETLGTWIWNNITQVFTTAFSYISSLGTWLYDLARNFFWSLFGGGSDSGSSSSINDAIITPNGDIIRTSPSDYLIATKNPASMMNGSGGSSNINVSINGGLITEDVAKKIGQIILKEVKRSGGY